MNEFKVRRGKREFLHSSSLLMIVTVCRERKIVEIRLGTRKILGENEIMALFIQLLAVPSYGTLRQIPSSNNVSANNRRFHRKAPFSSLYEGSPSSSFSSLALVVLFNFWLYRRPMDVLDIPDQIEQRSYRRLWAEERQNSTSCLPADSQQEHTSYLFHRFPDHFLHLFGRCCL